MFKTCYNNGMFYFMTVSFIVMPALGCFLLGLGMGRGARWPYSWIISLLGFIAFVSAFWHITRVDLWFIITYSLGPFLLGFGLPWELTRRHRWQFIGLGIFFLIFFVILYYLILRLLSTAVG